jgi:hypothetical protein
MLIKMRSLRVFFWAIVEPGRKEKKCTARQDRLTEGVIIMKKNIFTPSKPGRVKFLATLLGILVVAEVVLKLSYFH